MVMVLTHHSQLDESEFELNLPKPRFSFYKSRDTVECPADLTWPPGHAEWTCMVEMQPRVYNSVATWDTRNSDSGTRRQSHGGGARWQGPAAVTGSKQMQTGQGKGKCRSTHAQKSRYVGRNEYICLNCGTVKTIVFFFVVVVFVLVHSFPLLTFLGNIVHLEEASLPASSLDINIPGFV